ncbi:hypothetical protein QR680_008628 [Steinernema hermaphroditum]|uniref:G-protein coupled receptors family 1 profile domain-containing protein n=1 Tax=Steinernema hermaphroditum TaxID=289476 RepID=A0AA39M8F4_9BILA|nr:hypothetical protein QR680_008628 [Steinernema hermaphroditum]
MGEIDTHLSLSILRLIVFVVALLGNSLILFIILRSSRLRKSSSNLLLAQLAFADLFLGLAAGTRGTSNIIFASLGITEYEKALCLYLGMPTHFGIHISQLTILSISLDRFLCVKYPFLYRKTDSPKFALIRFIVCVLYSALGTASGYIGVNLDSQKIAVCSSGSVIAQWYSIYYLILSAVFSMFISVFYAAIYILFKRQSHNSISNLQRTLFVTMTAILITYFLFVGLPYTVVIFAKLFKAPALLRSYLAVFTAYLITLTSVANIFIYGWKHPEVRKRLKTMLAFKKTTQVEPMIVGSTKGSRRTQEPSEHDESRL